MKRTPALKLSRIVLLAAAIAAALPAAAALSGVTSRPNASLLAPSGPMLMSVEGGGMNLWFNSVLRPTLPPKRAVTICVTQQVITIHHGQGTETIEVPDAVIAFKPWEYQSSTYFYNDKWDTSTGSAQAGYNTFMSGVVEPLPSGLPSDTTSITWTARFESDVPGVMVQWQWGVAGYSQFSDSYDAVRVEAGNRRRSDSAGTPVDFKGFALGSDEGTQFVGSRTLPARVAAEVTGKCGGVY
jgi:hypothetical protein